MRLAQLLLASVLIAGAAHAQVVSPLGGSTNNPQGPAQPGPAASAPAASATAPSATTARPHRGRRTLAERFDAANTTHDGKLTLAQARAGHMNAVARDFAQIDKEKHGYVTMDDIRGFQKERREARRAARQAQAPAH
jgi:hypothetical protein